MPTLDDIPTLPQVTAVSANDSLVISETGGSGSSLVKRTPAVLATLGFTHAFRIDFDSASAAKGATGSGEIDLVSLTEGAIITDAAVMVSTNFDGPSITSYVIDVGTTADPNGLIAAFEMENSTALYVKNTGALLDDEEEVGGTVVGSSQSLSFTLTATGANLNTATAGSCIVFANILTPSELSTLVEKID